MRIGMVQVGFHKAGQTQQQVLQNCIDRMVLAEELGFDSVWLTEHHFGNDPAYHPFGLDGSEYLAYDLFADPLTILSHVAAKTKRVRLGTAVVVLHYDNPLRVAERAALVDIMSNGRLELGVGRGGGFREPDAFHVPQEGNRERFGEALDILQLAWTGKPFSYDGKFYKIPEVIVTPRPLQDPIPIAVAASTDDSFAWVGSRGLPFCFAGGAWGSKGWKQYDGYLQAYFGAAQKAGVDTSKFLFPQVVFAYCADTDKEAKEVTRYHLEQYQRMGEAHYERQRYDIVGREGPPPELAWDIHQTWDALADDVFEKDIIGSPESCIRKLKAYREHFNPNYLLLSPGFGAMPHDLVLKSLERLARYVLPALAEDREPVAS